MQDFGSVFSAASCINVNPCCDVSIWLKNDPFCSFLVVSSLILERCFWLNVSFCHAHTVTHAHAYTHRCAGPITHQIPSVRHGWMVSAVMETANRYWTDLKSASWQLRHQGAITRHYPSGSASSTIGGRLLDLFFFLLLFLLLLNASIHSTEATRRKNKLFVLFPSDLK